MYVMCMISVCIYDHNDVYVCTYVFMYVCMYVCMYSCHWLYLMVQSNALCVTNSLCGTINVNSKR